MALDAPRQVGRVAIQEVPNSGWGIAGKSAKHLER